MNKQEFVDAAKTYFPNATYNNLSETAWQVIQEFYISSDLDELFTSNSSKQNHQTFAKWVKDHETEVMAKVREEMEKKNSRISELQKELTRIQLEINLLSS